MSRLRLDLIVRTYPELDDAGKSVVRHLWTWRLWSGSRIVSTSGSQLYSRRIDCARGAEVGAGLGGVVTHLNGAGSGEGAFRWKAHGMDRVEVRLLDERQAKP